MRETVSDQPRFGCEGDPRCASEPCVLDRSSGGGGWHRGTGVRWDDHPLGRLIPHSACGACGGRDVLVVAAQRCVHPHSGDEYWDSEVRCCTCGRYTQRSFADNG